MFFMQLILLILLIKSQMISFQMIEHGLVVKLSHQTCKRYVEGSIPPLGTLGKVSENLFLGSTQAM